MLQKYHGVDLLCFYAVYEP